jgi:hypothetical protein
VAVADIGVDGNDLDAGVGGFFQRLNQLLLVDGRNQQDIGMLGDKRLEDRYLFTGVPFFGNLEQQLDVLFLGGSFGAAMHGEVERIDHTGQERHHRMSSIRVRQPRQRTDDDR